MKRELVSLQSYKINVGNDKPPKVVPATELYKFYRFQEIASAALVSSGHQGTNMDSKHEIFQEITKTLEEAWGLSEDRRRQVVKRLFLLWHPDKNPGNEEFCTEVFQHIKNEIERLEREGWGRRERERSESYHYGDGLYGAYFGFWGTRAKRLPFSPPRVPGNVPSTLWNMGTQNANLGGSS